MSQAKSMVRPMYLSLDRFQQMKLDRMACLLEELEQAKTIGIKEFLSHIAVDYGIRRNTGNEYLQDWLDAGCISIKDGKIKFQRRPKGME